MALSPFDTMKLCFTKDKYLSDEELQGYAQWMMNKQLSCDQTLVFLAHELNKPMSDRMHYDCLYHGLPKMAKKYIPYLAKKPKEEKEIQYISEYYKVDLSTAKVYHTLLSREELDYIVEFNEKRGVLKK